jgi:rod shape-determining protein MreC
MFSRRLFIFVGFALFIAIIFTVITISSRAKLPVNGIKRVSISLVSPFLGAATKTIHFTRDIWTSYFMSVYAAKEIIEIKKQLGEALEIRNRYEELELENIRLKKFVNFTSQAPNAYIAARVIARDPSPWFQTVMIDKGMEDGLKKGSPAMVSEGIVGQVVEVSGKYSRILLITDRNSAVDAFVQNSRVRGIVKGNNEDNCSFVYTLRKDDVREEEIIVTSGLDQVFPKGLMIGRVLSVTKDQSHLFQDVSIETSVDFEKIEEVLALKK